MPTLEEIKRNLDIIQGKVPQISRDIHALKLQEGEPTAFAREGEKLAMAAGEATPSQRFMSKLIELMSRSQQIGTRPLQERALTLEEEQAKRVTASLPSELIGASPTLQRGVRQAEAGALEPSIVGAKQRAQTFSEQIAGVQNILEQGRLMASYLSGIEEQNKEEAINWITKFPGAVQSLPESQQKEISKKAGVSIDFLKSIPIEKEEFWSEPYTLPTGETVQRGPKGEISVISKPTTGGSTSQQFKNLQTYVNGARAMLEELKSKMGQIDFPKNIAERYTKGQLNKARASVQADENLARFNALKNGMVSILARARGEVGVLTEQDIQRVKDSLPNLDDVEGVAFGKLDDINRTFDEFMARAGGTGMMQGTRYLLNNPETGETKEFQDLSPQDLIEAIDQGFIFQ